MNIDWVIPCRYVEVHDNLATIVGAGIDTYWVKELPAALQVTLAVRLLATTDELEAAETHTATNRIRNPEGVLLEESSAELAFQGESARPEWLTGIMLPAVVRFEATEEGTYTIEFAVGGGSDELPIHVVLGEP